MKWKTESETAANAATQLPKLARKYFDAGRKAVKAKETPKELHRFRVRTKRFRYALELFRPVYSSELEHRLDTLQHLQKLLGKISDSYTIRELLPKGHKKDLHKDGQKRIQEFRKYWKSEFDADGQENAWTSALSKPG